MTDIQIKTFSELSPEELYAILALRSEVFIVEQDCAYQDVDGLDPSCIHLLLWSDDVLAGYARIVPQGLTYKDFIAIGRVVSSPAFRGKKVGHEIFAAALEECKRRFPSVPIKISAQCYIKGFYESFGFQEIGESYLEDDIPHVAMIISEAR